MLRKIISGGQTGIDKAGLEIARSLGYETGGTAPKGYIAGDRKADVKPDMSLKDVYNLVELTDEQQRKFERITGHDHDLWSARTFYNARNSDGTVYFASDTESPGLKSTRRFCRMNRKPFLLNPTAEEMATFIKDKKIEVLNIAGNRRSKMPTLEYEDFLNTMREALESVNK